MEIINNIKIIYVWIGDKLPSYAYKSLEHSLKFSGCEVILLTTKNVIETCKLTSVSLYDINNFYIQEEKLFSYDYFGDKEFWNGFWIKTLERFYILNSFVQKYNITEFFHAELDNIIFKIDDLSIKLNKYGKGIFAPKDASDRVVGSLVYINNIMTLDKIIKSIDITNGKKNDMYILGDYFLKENDAYPLPIENVFDRNFKEWIYVPIEITDGIFDANAIGQYILGVDPRLDKYSPVYNQFKNENIKYDLDKCSFSYINSNFYIDNGLNKYKIYNLHVHSKLFYHFDNNISIRKLLNNVNSTHSKIVGKHYRIIFKYFVPYLRYIKMKIKLFVK